MGGENDVLGDAFLLEKALSNLVKNAMEFSSPGGRVDIRVRARSEAIEIAVSDRGAGIPGYAKARIFDRFYAQPKPGGHKGSGLGLSFVREIAALMSGTIVITSQEGDDTNASLILPKA